MAKFPKPINRVFTTKSFLIQSCDKFVLDESASGLVDREILKHTRGITLAEHLVSACKEMVWLKDYTKIEVGIRFEMF